MNTGMNTVLLTGASGFLGTQVARRLLQQPNLILLALVRAENQEAALGRLARGWHGWPELRQAIGSRVEVLCGNVALPGLGLSPTTYTGLVQRLTHIVHTAADLRLSAPLEELRQTNVEGTRNVLELARAVEFDHGLKRLAHVSTAYVCGRRRGQVTEEALSAISGFSNAYEQSKYEGECLVQQAKTQLLVSVFRPAMIVGDSRTGEVKTFNTFYVPLKLYLSGKLWAIPTSPDLKLDTVPVDYVAEAIARLTLEPQAEGLTFHLCAPYESLPTAGDLLTLTRAWAKKHLKLDLPQPLFVPLPEPVLQMLPKPSALNVLLPYFKQPPRFGLDRTERLLGSYKPQWREYLPKLLEYALYHGFMHGSERTVHEQILYRLEGHGPAIAFHDLVDEGVIHRSGPEVRQDMLQAASALKTMGIEKGDRIGLVGFNSSRYLTLDVAVGLVGAVSVPLYYTSPPADIGAILKASGAKLLLVGSGQLLERLGGLALELPLVSFCQSPLPQGLARALAWEEFLAMGKKPMDAVAPVGLGDLATLRYTSGTTGKPKGVKFNHQHLRWMAQSMASLVPWKTRKGPIAHLSFLPMNHVVEGILASYAPYFIPAPLDIYFLENFRQLERALPKVRPHIFFSVPRLFEKVWQAFECNSLVQGYLKSSNDWLKKPLRPLLRLMLLRKAGLDRCAQLIVGSAPADDELLRHYRKLGIEVHDAYGLTEAPLLTLNPVGANRIGTVGQALPQTEICIAEDGEVMVRGPQVTSGYFGEGIEQPFKNGWLLTGDLGWLNQGYLTIEGRKKELIATAYGKKIQPVKVEELLKEIPGVAEAMLVGENKPYCAALLWLEAEHPDLEVIDKAVLEANTKLSHPEQVKAWAILNNDLSIEGVDLTANLKLKRQAVGKRFQAVIEALYSRGISGHEFHIGRAEREERSKELV